MRVFNNGVFDLFCTPTEPDGRKCLGVIETGGTDRDDKGSFTIAAQTLLQQTGQLAISLGDEILPLLGLGQRLDHLAQGRQ